MKDDGKAFEVTRAIHEANLDIVGLQEVKRLQYEEATIQVKEAKYQLYWQGHSHKREAGVGILIKSCNYIRIEDVEAISPRLMIVKLFVHNTNLKFVVAYAPTEDKSDEIKNEFYEKLIAICQKGQNAKHQKLIVMGDKNATTSLYQQHCSFNGNKHIQDYTANDNGKRLIQFCRDKGLCMSSTYFINKEQKKITWNSPDGKTKKKLDYILCEPWIRQYMLNCHSQKSVNINSDHVILIAKMRTPYTKQARFRPRQSTKSKQVLDISALNNPKVKQDFINKTENALLSAPQFKDVDQFYDSYTQTINDCMAQTLPKKGKKKFDTIWQTDEKLNEMYEKMFNTRQTLNKPQVENQKLRKQAQKRKMILMNEHYKHEAEKINLNTISKDPKSLYQNAKKHSDTLHRSTTTRWCQPQEIANFFEKHFNPPANHAMPETLKKTPDYISKLQNNSDIINDNAPSLSEVKEIVMILQN